MVKYPDDWKVVSYGDVFIHHSAKEHQVSASAYATSGDYPVIDQGQMPVVGYTNDASCVMRCPRGGMIVFGDHTRIIKFVDFDFVVGADGTQLLSCKGCDARYVYYYMQSMHIPNLGYSRHFKYVKEGVYVLPPLPEQKRIAAVLGKVDKLIDNLSRQIEKKRLVKQGVMQDLLTGKKRLPGFKGEWRHMLLGDLLDYEQPQSYIVKSSEYVQDGVPVLTAGKSFILGYTNESAGIYSKLPVILFDDFLTVSRYVEFRFKVKSSAAKMLKLKDENNSLFYVFMAMQSLGYVPGDHQRHWISIFSKFEIDLPCPAEQKVIAKVLGDMDAEIAKLEAKHEKYRQLKQGLMNDLLTGKVRI